MTRKPKTLVEYGRWIPVEEALPDITLQLVVYQTQRGIQGLAQHFKGEGFMDPFEGPVDDVAHWYAFPQPPYQALPEQSESKRPTINLKTEIDRVSKAATVFADFGDGGFEQEYAICIDEKDTGVGMTVFRETKNADVVKSFYAADTTFTRLSEALTAIGWDVRKE